MLKGPDLLGCSVRLAHQKLDQITFSPQESAGSPRNRARAGPIRPGVEVGGMVPGAEQATFPGSARRLTVRGGKADHLGGCVPPMRTRSERLLSAGIQPVRDRVQIVPEQVAVLI